MRVLQLIDHVFSPELFALFLTARCDMFDCRSLGRDFEIRQLAFSCLPDRELLSREGTETLFLPTPGQSAERIDAVLDAITTFEPHLIHVMGAESNPSHNAVASAFGHIPIIFSYEGGPVASEDALPFLESCTALVYFDEEYRELVPAHLAERVRVRQRAVRTDLFRRLPGVTREYDFLQAAYWGMDKGQGLVVEVAEALGARVLFAGFGFDRPRFTHLVRQLPDEARARVHYVATPNHEQMPGIYCSASVFLWGSRSCVEHAGLLHNRSTYEALACGLPVVGFRDCLPDLPGVLLADSPQEFIRLARSSRDPSRWSELSAAGRRFVEQECDFETNYTEYFTSLYSELAG